MLTWLDEVSDDIISMTYDVMYITHQANWQVVSFLTTGMLPLVGMAFPGTKLSPGTSWFYCLPWDPASRQTTAVTLLM